MVCFSVVECLVERIVVVVVVVVVGGAEVVCSRRSRSSVLSAEKK